MTKEDTSLRAIAQNTLDSLAAWRDDVKVRVHLAGMDARDAWKEVEPGVQKVEGDLRSVLDAVVPGAAEQARLELHLGMSNARDRLIALRPRLEAIGHDLAKAGHEAIARLEAEVKAEIAPAKK